MFYCQHILGMGHLIRSMEIVRGLTDEFEVCFVNGGEVIQGFQPPPLVRVINIPAIKTDTEFRQLQPVDSHYSLGDVKVIRQQQLLVALKAFKPDVLMVELFPFGRRRFSFELIPLLEQARDLNAKIVCSLRDIIVTKQDKSRHEDKIIQLLNQYFDQLLIHGDPSLHPLEESFSRVDEVTCEVCYTGYVVQNSKNNRLTITDQISLGKQEPMILVSVGGGRFGHELLQSVIQAAHLLEGHIPHHIQLFSGPFIPEETFWELKHAARDLNNIYIHRYTPNLLAYMQKSDLSISMAGYNTTMNILTTGVRAMMLPFAGNDDREQTMRVSRLEQLGRVKQLYPEDLEPQRLAHLLMAQLQQPATAINVDLNGVQQTAHALKVLTQGTPRPTQKISAA